VARPAGAGPGRGAQLSIEPADGAEAGLSGEAALGGDAGLAGEETEGADAGLSGEAGEAAEGADAGERGEGADGGEAGLCADAGETGDGADTGVGADVGDAVLVVLAALGCDVSPAGSAGVSSGWSEISSSSIGSLEVPPVAAKPKTPAATAAAVAEAATMRVRWSRRCFIGGSFWVGAGARRRGRAAVPTEGGSRGGDEEMVVPGPVAAVTCR
jgi:hypothetical protein